MNPAPAQVLPCTLDERVAWEIATFKAYDLFADLPGANNRVNVELTVQNIATKTWAENVEGAKMALTFVQAALAEAPHELAEFLEPVLAKSGHRLVEPGHVMIPTTAEEARAMRKLGQDYLDRG